MNAVWLYDYAYETVPNTPILAGEGAVPEPTTISLFLLATALITLKRSKKRPL